MSKVIILNNTVNLDNIMLGKSESLIIIGEKTSLIPLAILEKLMQGKAKFSYIENPSVAAYAFELGKIYEKEKVTEVITDIEEIENLLKTPQKPAPKKKQRQAASGEEKPAEAEKTFMNLPEETEENKNESVADGTTVSSKEVREPIKKENKKAKTESSEPKVQQVKHGRDYGKISKGQVVAILKKHGYDAKYADAILKGLTNASDVTLDINVRTQLALVEENGEIIRKIADVMKAELG